MTDEVPTPLDLTQRSWVDALPTITERLARVGSVEIVVPRPDPRDRAGPGEATAAGAPRMTLRDWLDLSDALGARLVLPPDAVPPSGDVVRLRFERRGAESSLHAASGDRSAATHDVRYGADGPFARLRKMDLPGFRLPLQDALGFARGGSDASDASAALRALVIGCHRGDEVDLLVSADPPFSPERVVGVDRHREALGEARRRHPEATFIEADVASLATHGPLPVEGRFDLVVAIAVLQSPTLDGPAVLRGLVRHHATERGGLIVGVPASRLQDGEIVWGARTRNYTEIDLSLVVRDLAGHRRYLHQHGYRTRIGGRYDLLLAAYRERSTSARGSADRAS